MMMQTIRGSLQVSAAAARKERRATSPGCYEVSSVSGLKEGDRAAFAAAGALILHPEHGLFMPIENRKGEGLAPRLNVLGGKRDAEDRDDPRTTAARELFEGKGTFPPVIFPMCSYNLSL